MYEVDSKVQERAILVGVTRPHERKWITEDHLDELALLADTAGAEVIDRFIQERDKIDPAYFIGRGKAETIAAAAKEQDVDIIIFDDDLSPAQVRNLERMSDKKILDRSGIILDIFARRAKSREARTQVELAQLNYLLPRLTRQWTHLSRQVGGIGTRGPGETQLEVDRRLIRNRIATLTKELEKIKKQRRVRRTGRKEIFKAALVGYTNAGKSTLMNALTDSDVFVENRLFATLDATVRRLKLENDVQVLLIDTVGFIRKLPHHLVASFMSTLEEAIVADLLVHVVDISHPLLFEQIATVKQVLKQLQISDKPIIFVFNKIDKLQNKAIMTRLEKEFQAAVFVSAQKGLFLGEVRKLIYRESNATVQDIELHIDISHPDIVSKVYELAEVSSVKYGEDGVIMTARAEHDNAEKLKHLFENRENGQDRLIMLSHSERNKDGNSETQ